MKKSFLCFILAIAMVFGCLAMPNNVSANEDYNSYSTYVWLEKFVTANPSRTTGTNGEVKASFWLQNELSKMGYQVERQTFMAKAENVAGVTTNLVESNNIIVTKKSVQSGKKVVIGAHYDNATSLYKAGFVTGGDGAMDNGSGVAVLLDLAQKLSQSNVALPFDLEFVFFGAEEVGMLGSNHYVSKLSQQQKDDILLMINVDVVASGDNLYVWGEDKKTPQANYFADQSNGKISKTPANTKAMGVHSGYRPYYTVCQASDHMEFLSQGIPVAAFFSGNFKSGTFEFVENKGKADVSHTQNDTINYLKNNFGIKFAQNMQTVSDTIFSGVMLNANTFVDEVKDARNYIVADFWLNINYALGILALLIVLAGVFAYRYHKKLQKRAILGSVEIKTNTVFEKPDEDDIFTFRS